MVQYQAGIANRVYAGKVTDVIPVGLEPANHRVFRIKKEGSRLKVSGIGRPVVADFQTPDGEVKFTRIPIKTMTAIVVIGLPRQIGCLIEDVRGASVIANDKTDVTVSARIVP